VPNSAAVRSDDPPPGSDTPAANFTELRSLLVGPEQRQLRALQTRLEDPAAQARDVSRVLATAVELRTRDPHLQRALAPTIEEAITTSVRRNPRPLADALFPIIGPAIRKAISATLNGMLESLNTTLEHSLSWRSLRWRLDARRTGRPFAEIVLLNTLVYRVEQVFLIHRPSGLLLQHLTASGTTAQDADMVSGMLTAIRDFVQDSFKVDADEGLQTLKVGDLSVWIEQGPHALLAVVVRGTAPPSLRTTLQQTLEAVHAQYSDLLESFDGNAARFEGARPLLEACFQQEFRGRERPRGIPPRVMVIAAIVLLAIGVWMFFALRARSRWNGYLNALRAQPGLVVVSTSRVAGKYVVTGLRDPLAADPATLLPPHSLGPDNVEGRWELYQALHPSIVIARARQLLAPPGGVSLELEDGVLMAAGSAPVEWIETAVQVAPFLPGVARFEARPVIDSALAALAASIEGSVPTFVKGSTAFTAGSEAIVTDQIARLAALDALGRAARRQFTVELVGEADADGAPESNRPLSERRAERVRSLLATSRLEHITLTATGIGSRTAAGTADDETRKQRNRRVSFYVNRDSDRR
jgi:outer membrane protein OmpA-like peptidoglycan-associated protein